MEGIMRKLFLLIALILCLPCLSFAGTADTVFPSAETTDEVPAYRPRLGSPTSSLAYGRLTLTEIKKLIQADLGSRVYIAYASDSIGTGFSLEPGAGLNYIAFLIASVEIANPVVSDFEGLWIKVKGDDGVSGVGVVWRGDYDGIVEYAAGDGVRFGACNYIANDTVQTEDPDDSSKWDLWICDGELFSYVGYASDDSGSDFSLSPGEGLTYLAFLFSYEAITPVAGDFDGLWFFAGGVEQQETNLTRTLTTGGASAFISGEIGYINSSGVVVKASASSATTASGLLVMAAETVGAGSSGLFTTLGDVTKTGHGQTPGLPLFLTTTAGGFSTTAPALPNVQRVIGYALTSNIIVFNPSAVWVQ